jgi:hypothetical protein
MLAGDGERAVTFLRESRLLPCPEFFSITGGPTRH